jgi:hypothetical protein
MAIRSEINKIQLLIAVAAILTLSLGCGTDDESIVEPDMVEAPDTAVKPDMTKEPDVTLEPDVPRVEADPVIPVEPPEDQAEEVEEELPTIRGLVLDQVTKDPLIGVNVKLTDEAGVVLETPTANSGVFEFEGVAADQKITVTIDINEYEKQEFIVDPIPVGETVKLEVELIPLNPQQLPVGDGLAVGLKAPDFNPPDSDGEMIALADYAGNKKVVLVFDRGEW